MAGFFHFIAAVFGKGAAGYATLLVFSLATITGSMYVLSTREANQVILATSRFSNSTLSIESQADFRPENQVRTVIVNFEGGIATGLREAVTNLAGAIRAVSSNIIAEAQREDAARAAASAARPSAFGLSADSQIVSQAPALAAAGLGAITPPPPPAVPTIAPAAPTAPPAIATTPPLAQPTAPQPTQAPAQTTPFLPTQTPAQATAVQATPVPATSTPLPPAPTATPEPPAQQQPQPTGVPSQPTTPPLESTIAAIQATTPALAATVAAAPTVVPTAVATLVPTRVSSVATFVPAQLSLVPGSLTNPIFSFSGNLPGGQAITRDIVLGNDGAFDFHYYLSTSGGTGPLWTDTVNGLQARVTVDGVQRYSGPIQFNQQYMAMLGRSLNQTMNITITLPVGVPNLYQGETMSASFKFNVVQA